MVGLPQVVDINSMDSNERELFVRINVYLFRYLSPCLCVWACVYVGVDAQHRVRDGQVTDRTENYPGSLGEEICV